MVNKLEKNGIMNHFEYFPPCNYKYTRLSCNYWNLGQGRLLFEESYLSLRAGEKSTAISQRFPVRGVTVPRVEVLRHFRLTFDLVTTFTGPARAFSSNLRDPSVVLTPVVGNARSFSSTFFPFDFLDSANEGVHWHEKISSVFQIRWIYWLLSKCKNEGFIHSPLMQLLIENSFY